MTLRFTDPADFQTQLLRDPALFAQDIDFTRELILFLHLSREDYQRASFLDARIITPQRRGAYIRYSELDAALGGSQRQRPLHFIFHAGHVGSTLLSRLLEGVDGVLALREPAMLKSLADAEAGLSAPDSLVSPDRFARLINAQRVLWGRGYPGAQATIVKATSTAVTLAPRLLVGDADIRAICLNLALEPYLAALLSGENSHLDLRGHGPGRMRRLALMAGPPAQPLYDMSTGELAAMAWTIETLTHAKLRQDFGERVLAINFDELLQNVGASLQQACAHLKLDARPAVIAGAAGAAGAAALKSYSKAPEHAYSPQVRQDKLNEARRIHATEISKGLRWFEAFAAAAPSVAALLMA